MAKRTFTFATFAAATRACVAVNVALGYPKIEGIPRTGGPPARLVPAFVRPKRVPPGHPLEGQGVGGVVILPVDRPAIVALNGRTLTIPATYGGRAVPGGAGSIVFNLASARDRNPATDDIDEED